MCRCVYTNIAAIKYMHYGRESKNAPLRKRDRKKTKQEMIKIKLDFSKQIAI